MAISAVRADVLPITIFSFVSQGCLTDHGEIKGHIVSVLPTDGAALLVGAVPVPVGNLLNMDTFSALHHLHKRVTRLVSSSCHVKFHAKQQKNLFVSSASTNTALETNLLLLQTSGNVMSIWVSCVC